MVEIIENDPVLYDYSEQVLLDGALYGLRFRWNHRADAWFMDVFDSTGSPLIMGRRLVVGLPLLRQHHALPSPTGEMLMFDTANTDRNPALTDLGTRVLTMYVTAAELGR